MRKIPSERRRRPLAPRVEAMETRSLMSGVGAAAGTPLTVTVALSRASDPDGNGVVTRDVVQIEGVTAPGATVRLVPGPSVPSGEGRVTRADAQGHFQFRVLTGIGVTPLRFVATDRSGGQATADLSVTHGDAVIAWERTMLEAIRADRLNVGLASRDMAMVSGAVYDAVNAIDRTHAVYRIDVAAPRGASRAAAASEAAYRVLTELYPDQKARFDATLAESLASIPAGAARRAGLRVGDAVAAGMMAWRANDGSTASVPYTPGTEPGQWQPTYPGFQVAWGPEWGQVTPFAMDSATPFLPPPPPSMTSDAYTAAFNEVKSVGALDSTTRTPEQTQIAHFWAYDRAGMGPPPVLYDQIAETIALQQHNTLSQDARMFGLVNVAMADAGIVAWDAKYAYNFWRPITGIRLAGADGNPATVADPNWLPLGAPGGGVVPDFTPAFPAYISGHATFGAAMFRVLADFYGTDRVQFTIGSDELPGVHRSFDSFSAAAEENGQSRIYLGIHWSFDKTYGIATGSALGDYVFRHAMS